MRYSLSARQPKSYLQKVDEIVLAWRDRDILVDLLEINPNATIVLELDNTVKDEDWNKIKKFNTMCQWYFEVCCLNEQQMEMAKIHNLNFFYAGIIDSPYQINALVNYGVCGARIGGQLGHQLDFVATLPIEIRVIANYAFNWLGYEPIYSSWFRPEDLTQLTDIIDVCEFSYEHREEGQALYRIYAEQKKWPGMLNMIIKQIDDGEILNEALPSDFQERRSNCGMRCQVDGNCRFCKNMFRLAKAEVIKRLRENNKNV